MKENKKGERSIIKVLTIKECGRTYYVQSMPGYGGLGRNYAVMRDRERFYYGRFDTYGSAKAWLLKRLLTDMGQRAIDLHL